MKRRITITAHRWPWQENGAWNKGIMGRFGGGWNYKIGLDLGGFRKKSSLIINLIFGMVRISWDFTK